MKEFSDFIAYVDESGDHSLVRIDPEYPVFVLAFCLFEKHLYARKVVPAIQEFKFEFFGHDMVVLHEHEMRKARGDFRILLNAEVRERFMAGLNGIVGEVPFLIVATAIRKDQLARRYAAPDNPYHLALTFCLERLHRFLDAAGQGARVTHVVCERRGTREDEELELAFRRVCDGGNYRQEAFPFRLVMADKKANSSGLQLADMVARPVGKHVLSPDQPNRAFEILKEKFYRSRGGAVEGWGLKHFP